MSQERRGSWLAMLAALVLLAVVGAIYLAYREFGNPWFQHMPEWKEADGYFKTMRTRPLTDAEFARAVQLSSTGNDTVRVHLMIVLEIEANRDVSRRPASRAALQAMAADPDFPAFARRTACICAGRIPPDDAPAVEVFKPQTPASSR